MLYPRLALGLAAVASFAHALSTDIETGSQKELDLSVLLKHQSPPHPVEMRLPPTFGTESDKWVPTPGDWFLGTWYFTHSNQPTYQSWKNMQWTLSATANNSFDDTLNDLTTFQLLNGTDTTTVWGLYGVDTRTVVGGNVTRDAYNYLPTGALAFAHNVWEVIAWGYDKRGVPYAVVYETMATGQITDAFDIISRNDDGPSRDTLDMIYEAVGDLKNARLSALLAAVKSLKQNGGRNGESFPTCNAVCMTNVKNPFGL